LIRKRIIVSGQVQGVGFRPFVYRLAHELKLVGWVKNSNLGVEIEVQGTVANVDAFRRNLYLKLPPLAKILKLRVEDRPVRPDLDFKIVLSEQANSHQVLISPDIATCSDCLRDLFDSGNRRYLYSFTNCTNCGPRYTITKSIPYDRKHTSMACFKMCAKCEQEYNDPLDRRFHAQPNCCPECGPKVWLTDSNGKQLGFEIQAIAKSVDLLLAGKILAIKGLGGFHLACAAWENDVVLRLRARKNRPNKSLAVMVPDLEIARQIALISEQEEKLLLSPARPIVILARKTDRLSFYLAPDTLTIGLVLPYTPLQHILFKFLREKTEFPVLVMTSGNASAEPICLGNREALNRLGNIADFFLLHDRDILIRCDDSVLAWNQSLNLPLFLRRARGYVPTPVPLSQKGPVVLGVGAHLKNTICLSKEDQAFVSQYIGTLSNLETYDFFEQTIEHFQKILAVKPEAICCDLHPDYLSTKFAQEQNLPLIKLQHHLAHLYAVLAENEINEPVLGWALDGTGLGLDNTIWGGELFWLDPVALKHKRIASFEPLPLPGGEQAIWEPWRIGVAILLSLQEDLNYPWPLNVPSAKQVKVIQTMLEQAINTPLCSSLGRIFDAVASLLGLITKVSYEGQAAILLEKIQAPTKVEPYLWKTEEKDGVFWIKTKFWFEQIITDLKKNVSPAVISRKFHLSVQRVLVELGLSQALKYGVKKLAFSGGVMQNLTLAAGLPKEISQKGLLPVFHHKMPPNDSSIAFGQVVYAQRFLLRSNS